MSAVNCVVVTLGLRQVDGSDCILRCDMFDAACYGRMDMDRMLWFAVGNNDEDTLFRYRYCFDYVGSN